MLRRCLSHLALWATLAVMPAMAAQAPSTEIHTEYVLSLLAMLDPEIDIDDSLSISNVNPVGSWIEGPRLKGKIIAPSGDWLRLLPTGVMRLDVRLTIRTDDGALIYMSYNGVLQEGAEAARKAQRGETLTASDMDYFMVAPTFETSAPKYMWLNSVQAVARMVGYKEGKGGFVKYDVFSVR